MGRIVPICMNGVHSGWHPWTPECGCPSPQDWAAMKEVTMPADPNDESTWRRVAWCQECESQTNHTTEEHQEAQAVQDETEEGGEA